MPKNGWSGVRVDTGQRKEDYRALAYGVTVSPFTRRTRLAGLLNRPQRKPLSGTESGILKVNKINPAIVTSTDQRFVVSKNKGGERASILPGLNSNDHVILVYQLMGGDNFCGNGGHSRPFGARSLAQLNQLLPYSFRKIDLAFGYGSRMPEADIAEGSKAGSKLPHGYGTKLWLLSRSAVKLVD